MMEWVITAEYDGVLLRDFLRAGQSFSRRTLNAIKNSGGKILVNGVKRKVHERVRQGDQVEVHFPPEEKGYYMFAEPIPLDIMYEDEYILVLNKEAGMVSSPSPHCPAGTVANALLYHYEQHEIDTTVHIVTRLDRGTSGVMLIAKNQYIHSLCNQAHMQGKIMREYKAIVEGCFEEKEGSIRAKIGRKEGSIIERQVTEEGKEAITHYEVLQQTSQHALVAVSLETGRTHQIRVHFAYKGYPVAGDTLYGNQVQQFIKRQALHSSTLTFKHPIYREHMSFHVELPEDMLSVLTTV